MKSFQHRPLRTHRPAASAPADVSVAATTRPTNSSTPTLSFPLHRSADVAAAVPSVPAVVATVFGRLRLKQRARVLRRLLLPVGPMALAVVGGGVFAKYAAQARWSRLYPSLEDVARVTTVQVYELVRYVEQANPAVLPQVMAVLARDTTTMTALGASLAAIITQYLAAEGRPR